MFIHKFKVPTSLYSLFFLIILLISCNSIESPPKNSKASVNLPALLDRGSRIQNGKEWDNSQNFYGEAISKLTENPNDTETKLSLAQLYIQEARVTGEHGHYYPAALQMCSEILNNDSTNDDQKFRTLTVKAGVQLSLHEFANAKSTAEQALLLNNRNAQIHGVMVDALVELGQYEEALKEADIMISIKPDLRSYSRISYLREIHGDIEGSKKALKMAVDAGYPGQDQTAWAMITLGELYNQYGEPEKAKIIYEAILTERQDYPFAVGAIANYHYEKGDLDIAEKMLDDARTIIPEVGFYTQLAQIYKDQGRTKEFKATMDEVFVMLKEDVESGHNMNLEYVDIYLNLIDDKEKAMAYAKKEYEKRPDNIDVNRAMALVLRSSDKSADVSKYLTAASRTGSKHPELSMLK